MQQSQESRRLLTALDVQQLLHVDRSTVYRMAEDGRLPALRVGRSWRFPADRIAALLSGAEPAAAPTTEGAVPLPTTNGDEEVPAAARPLAAPAPLQAYPGPPSVDASGTVNPAAALNVAAAAAAAEVGAELLGVMMVVTDMSGRPVTEVANPCAWFTAHAGEPQVLQQCVAEWRDLADHPDLTPRFAEGALGFECARSFVRSGSHLVGMVLAGGLSPSPDADTDPGLYHLDAEQRGRVLDALPRIAAAISMASTTRPGTARSATPAPPTPTTEENR